MSAERTCHGSPAIFAAGKGPGGAAPLPGHGHLAGWGGEIRLPPPICPGQGRTTAGRRAPAPFLRPGEKRPPSPVEAWSAQRHRRSSPAGWLGGAARYCPPTAATVPDFPPAAAAGIPAERPGIRRAAPTRLCRRLGGTRRPRKCAGRSPNWRAANCGFFVLRLSIA